MLVLIAVASVLLTVDPCLTYGVWVEDGVIEANQDDVIKAGICNVTSVDLVPVERALDLLRYRVDGLSDPVTGMHMIFQAA